MIRFGWVPPVSPYGLIQETFWPDEWMILVVCMLLNCTQRKQVELVLPSFQKRWSDPCSFVAADFDDVVVLCRPLGFATRRTKNLKKMTTCFLTTDWNHAGELPGIGAYASRAWEMFCKGIIGDEPPCDHVLVKYWSWCRLHGYGSVENA